jgi:hypothetical protein
MSYNPTAGGSGDMLSTNNLSDVVSAATARTNLGVAIGTNVQAWSAQLDNIAAQWAKAGVFTAAILHFHEGTTNGTNRIQLAGQANLAADYTLTLPAETGTLVTNVGGVTFTNDISVPAEAYDATAWNGSNEVPTKNDVRDKIETLAPLASPTFTGTVTTPAIIVSSETASRVAIIDGSQNIKSADTATYPSLTELAYVKGATSSIQTQLNGKEPTLTNGFGITGTTTKAVSLTTASAFATAETTISAATYADITGCSVSLAAGTWLIFGHVVARAANGIIQVFTAITHSDNTVIAESATSRPASGTASLNSPIGITWQCIVTPGSTTTYKLRGARGLTTHTGSWVAMDGNGVNTTNHATNNTDKGTSIIAIRIA